MLDPAVLPAFVLASALICLAPGPDNAFVSAVALRHGPRVGVTAAAGMALGMSVHVLASGIGLAVVLKDRPWIATVIEIVGAGYLAFLAYATLTTPHAGPRGVGSRRRVLVQAVITNLTNPKVILFFAAFLPSFATGSGALSAQLLVLGLVFLVVGLLCDAGFALAAGMLGTAVNQSGRTDAALRVVAAATYGVISASLMVSVAHTI